MKVRSWILAAWALCALALVSSPAIAGPSPARAATRPNGFGAVRVLSAVPDPPGYPEGIAVNGNRMYVAGPARFGTAGNGQPSRVYAFDTRSGELVKSFAIRGEDLKRDHRSSSVALDGEARLYVINTQLGIVRLDPATGQQQVYAPPPPDLPTCAAASGNAPCSPTVQDTPPLPNDLAFDAAGNLYLTDSFQATIWRIPAGGGQPQIWFQDSQLDTAFGPNGLRVDPTGTRLYFSVTADSVNEMGLYRGGAIYSLPLVDSPSASDLQVFHAYHGEGPDGIAFGRSGNLYVALAVPYNSGISVLAPDGTEIARPGNPKESFYPYDSPANLAFDGQGDALVTNHAFATGIPAHFTVLSVYVNDKAWPLNRPVLP